MKQKKNKIINLILFAVLLLLLVLWSLLDFCIKQWDDLRFETILRQLSLTMSGTDPGMVALYFKKHFAPVAIIFLVVLALFIVTSVAKKKLKIKYRLFDKKSEFVFYSKVSKNAIIVSLAALVLIGVNANRLGIFSYIDNRVHPSEIFEQYYVDARNTAITFGEDKKNLIFIYAESIEAGYSSIEEGGASDFNYIPRLTQLAKENVNFSKTSKLGGGFDTKGTSDFTASAIIASSTGVPFLSGGGNNASMLGQIMPGIDSLGDILKKNGYDNYFQCGSDATFGSRREFYEQHGDYDVEDYGYALSNGYIPEGYHNGFWGYEDLYLFDIAKKRLTDIASEGKPFNYTMLTVDTHFPNGYRCDLCKNDWSNYYGNSLSCSDRQITDFVKWCETQPWYEDTLIVIVGDHTTMKEGFVKKGSDRVTYNCFVNPADSVSLDNTKNRLFTTMDLLPTVLSGMGASIDGDRLGLGTNLFSGKQTVTEEMGFENYMDEINRFSKYYNKYIDMND